MRSNTPGGSFPSSRLGNEPQTFSGPCVLWAGKLNNLGYGILSGRPTRMAHREAYERDRGPIPEGLEIDHLCGNRRCVRVDHLEAVTHAENCRRRFERSGRRSCVRVPLSRVAGECSHGHAMTPANTYIVPATGRPRCRQCMRDRLREHIDREVRPTLSALADSVCSTIRTRANLGLPLPIGGQKDGG